MEKIIEFKLIEASNLKKFEESINEFLFMGWCLYGETKIISNDNMSYKDYFQTLVRYDIKSS